MSFKKNEQKSQLDLFATALFSLPVRERRYMEDNLSWHNEFYRNLLLNIYDAGLLPLFDMKNRQPGSLESIKCFKDRIQSSYEGYIRACERPVGHPRPISDSRQLRELTTNAGIQSQSEVNV